MTRDLVSMRTRNAFREFLVGSTLREISMLFEEAHIACATEVPRGVSGERRSLVEQHYRTLDFTKAADTQRLMAAYHSVIQRAEASLATAYDRKTAENAVSQLKTCLSKDGYTYTAARIVPTTPETRAALEPPRTVSEVTRRAIFDEFVAGQISWWGQLSEADFLGRLYDLATLPSQDGRYKSMSEDVWQHREHNQDWGDNWVFTDSRLDLARCSDERLLRFLCEMAHPLVRPEQSEARRLIRSINRHLLVDGWELVESGLISGRPTFAASRRSSGAVALPEPAHATDVLSDEYVRELAGKCDERLARGDLEGAITVARTLLEQVLRELEVQLAGKAGDYSGDLPKQFKTVIKMIRIDDTRTDIDDGFKQVARGLVQIVSGIAPIRNRMSDGHARERKPAPHHARIVVNAAKTVATFLVESYGFQRARGGFAVPASSLNTVERTGGDPA